MNKVLIKGGRIDIDVHVHMETPMGNDVYAYNVDYSLFESHNITGKMKKVFLRGTLTVDGTEWLGRAGMGQYLSRSASGRVL
ncbi:MAG: hypothetical protein AAF171_06525 [Cyanobacteria bacterium P01_A01_bin.116]